jgi:zinc transporter, ZIP family
VSVDTGAALAFAAMTFFSTLAGGITALRWPGRSQALMALAGGVVLAAAFFDLLPEAVQQASEIDMSVTVPLGLALVGYLVFHLFDRFVHRHPLAEGEGEQSVVGLIGAGGFVVHSFFDGLAIGLGFQISAGVGVIVAVAVLGHDFSDGLNTVSYMAAHHQPARRSLWMLIADAFTPLVGALIATLTPVPDSIFPLAIGFFAGLFVFAATTRLLPGTVGLSYLLSSSLTVGGAVAMFLVSRLA